MGKGNKAKEKRTRAKITPDMERKILSWAKVDYPHLQRTKLAHKLRAEFGKGAPKLEVLERKISWYRKNVTDDPPFSMAVLAMEGMASSFPPETLPAVVAVYRGLLEHGMKGRPPGSRVLSVREAKWVARLSGLEKDIAELTYMALQYASWEFNDEVHNRPLWTLMLDAFFFGMKRPDKLQELLEHGDMSLGEARATIEAARQAAITSFALTEGGSCERPHNQEG